MTTSKLWKDPLARHESDDSSNISFHPAGKSKLSENQIQQLDAVEAGTPATIPAVTFALGCFTFATTLCAGSCGAATYGCCG